LGRSWRPIFHALEMGRPAGEVPVQAEKAVDCFPGRVGNEKIEGKRPFEEVILRANGLNLVVAAITLWSTVCLRENTNGGLVDSRPGPPHWR
jgi:hypothetical protein